jgi:pyruvate,water dikinase
LIQYAPQGGTVELDVPPERRALPALSDDQVAQLAALSGRIEAHYQTPMDIEWGYSGGRFYILQARPITALKPAALPAAPGSRVPPGEYNRTMFIEIFAEPISPVFLSVLQPDFHAMLDFTFQTLGFKPPHDIEAVGIFYNQPYFHREYIEGALKPLSPPVREQLVAQIVNPFSRHARTVRGELSPAFIGMTLRLLRFLTGFPSKLPGIVARYRSEIKAFEAIDLQSASDREIVERLRELALGTGRRFLSYDFLMIAMIGLTYQTLGTLLARYFGDDSEEVRSKLVSGVTGNVTMQTNKKIWDLGRVAKRSVSVSDALRRYEGEPLRAQLAETADGRAFLAELDGFLAEYGHREVRLDILYPTWVEDPSPVLAFVRGYLDVGDQQSPYHQQDRLVAQRAELMALVRERVQRDWRGRLLTWPLFNWVLKYTQAHTRERDTMHFELTRLFPPFRRALLEIGRRWTASGLVDAPDDVFYLTLDELLQVAESRQPQQALVQTRRAELAASRRQPAPGIIRDGRAIIVEAAAQAVPGAGEFHGIAGSPGLATGAARLVLGPEDFGKLKSGEILVAPITNPVWTPLFAIAGGIVTEIGGILSHGAIVAREYGIPAVMAVPGVTAAIAEGKRVTVDGNRGVVTVES